MVSFSMAQAYCWLVMNSMKTSRFRKVFELIFDFIAAKVQQKPIIMRFFGLIYVYFRIISYLCTKYYRLWWNDSNRWPFGRAY